MQIQKTIREFVGDKQAPLISGDAPVSEAIELMKDKDSACVLIVEGSVLKGIFTERDFLARVVGEGKEPDQTTVASVMSEDPRTLGLDACVTYAVNLMALGGYRNVPIVSDKGEAVAHLSIHDITSHLAQLVSELGESGERDEWTDLGGGD